MRVMLASRSARRDDDPGHSSERLINFYPEAGAEASKAGFMLRAVPGMVEVADLGSVVVRAFGAFNGQLWAVASGLFYRIGLSGTVTTIGSLGDGETFLSENGTDVTICAGGVYSVWNGTSIVSPGSGRIVSPATVGYHAGYTLLTDAILGEFEWTALADAETRNALNFATAESRNDALSRVMVNGREVWLFGTESTEVWFNTGQAGPLAFQRLPGAAVDRGILAAGLATRIAESVFVVGNDGVVYATSGTSLNPVSDPVVEASIAAAAPTHMFAYEDRGRKFVCLRFAARPAWCLDVTTGRWHERASGVNWAAWDVIAAAQIGAEWYGITLFGTVFRFARVPTDLGGALSRMAQSRPIYRDGEFFTVDWFEVLGEMGTSSLGRAATVALQVSRDGGFTWEPQVFRSMGALGNYGTRAVWDALGSGYEMAFRVVVTDAAEINVYSAANMVAG